MNDLAEILEELDTFKDRVYWLVQMVPEGTVATSGRIGEGGSTPTRPDRPGVR